MSKEQKFFICKHCGNLVGMIHSSGVKMVCCGDEMTELKANTSEGAGEKHLPVISVDGNLVTVTVGEVLHPMVEEHYIQWVYLHTEQGGQRKWLAPGEKPEVTFALTEDDAVIEAFEYCNLHGLWKTTL